MKKKQLYDYAIEQSKIMNIIRWVQEFQREAVLHAGKLIRTEGQEEKGEAILDAVSQCEKLLSEKDPREQIELEKICELAKEMVFTMEGAGFFPNRSDLPDDLRGMMFDQ